MYDVIIIGMGISGITASIYGKRAGLNVLILEKSAPGGQLSNLKNIKNYPGYVDIEGYELALKLFDQVKSLGIDYKFDNVTDICLENDYKKIITSKGEYIARNVIIATGRSPKYLENTESLIGRGISTCATCDGALYKDENVAVVGSDKLAVDEARYLSNIVKKVYLINKNDSFDFDISDMESSNVEFIYNATIKEILKDEIVKGIVLSNSREIDLKAIFVYSGYRPNTEFLSQFDVLSNDGHVIVDDKYETKIDGIYAVGDVIKKDLYQLVTASSDGASCMNYIIKKLRSKKSS